jgi:hypothetical protein
MWEKFVARKKFNKKPAGRNILAQRQSSFLTAFCTQEE